MSIKLGTKGAEVTLALPNRYQPALIAKGAKHELQSGKMEFDLVARRWTFSIGWRWLTAAEKDVIITQAQKTSLSLIDFGAAQYDVEMIETLNVEYTEGTNPVRYHVTLNLEQK